MKKTLLFASAAVLLCGCGTGSKYVVEGHIAGLEGTVYLFQQDSLIDSAVVKSGKFRFSGPAGAPAMHYLLDSRDGQPQAFAMQLILEPGTISIKSDADDPQVRHTTGTPANALRWLVSGFHGSSDDFPWVRAMASRSAQIGRAHV